MKPFDLVLMKTSTLREDLYDFMGWDCTADDYDGNEKPKAPGPRLMNEAYFQEMKSSWNAKLWNQLRKENELDTELVEYGRHLNRIDKKVFHHHLFNFWGHNIQYDTCLFKNDACGYLCK